LAAFALISVYNKNGINHLASALQQAGYDLLSTGGTASYLQERGYEVHQVEDLTEYPSILAGRVKTLHPKVFGGILARSQEPADQKDITTYQLPTIDVVVVDLYPFAETLREGGSHTDIIEKIDIGGISLLRAAAKNYERTWVISGKEQYQQATEWLQAGSITEEQRQAYAARAFALCVEYDTAIATYLSGKRRLNLPLASETALRYGENPHQEGLFYGNLAEVFEQKNGKALSYNNLLDCDAALQLIEEFEDTTLAVIKHNNACGAATRSTLAQAWQDALAGDPVSAFGGVLVCNRTIDKATAEAMHQIFFEVLMAPGYEAEALALLQKKKNRIILQTKAFDRAQTQYRSTLNGFLAQDRDSLTDRAQDEQVVSETKPTNKEKRDMVFAAKIAKHTKSNTIVLARNEQLLGSGTGQSSRVDALKQAIHKAESFNFDLKGAVMASDAFFPFPDCVEIAHKAGITAVIQPGGSIRDQESVDYCNAHNMSMIFTGNRHFKH